MTGDVVISEVDAHMYVILSKAEEHMSYGELVGTREYITLQMRCHKTKVFITEFNCIYGPMFQLR